MKFISIHGIAVWATKHRVHLLWTCIGYTKVHADMACKRPLYFLVHYMSIIKRFSYDLKTILLSYIYIYIYMYISVPLDLKVTLKDTRLILNIIYVWKLNQTVLELDFRAVKFLFFPRRDLNPHHCYTAAPFA